MESATKGKVHGGEACGNVRVWKTESHGLYTKGGVGYVWVSRVVRSEMDLVGPSGFGRVYTRERPFERVN